MDEWLESNSVPKIFLADRYVGDYSNLKTVLKCEKVLDEYSAANGGMSGADAVAEMDAITGMETADCPDVVEPEPTPPAPTPPGPVEPVGPVEPPVPTPPGPVEPVEPTGYPVGTCDIDLDVIENSFDFRTNNLPDGMYFLND